MAPLPLLPVSTPFRKTVAPTPVDSNTKVVSFFVSVPPSVVVLRAPNTRLA